MHEVTTRLIAGVTRRRMASTKNCPFVIHQITSLLCVSCSTIIVHPPFRARLDIDVSLAPGQLTLHFHVDIAYNITGEYFKLHPFNNIHFTNHLA